MSWGSKGDNGGPWGNPNSGGANSGGNGGQKPPSGDDFEEILRRGQERMRGMFGGGNDAGGDSGKKTGLVISVLLLLLWLASGVYVVDTQEQGVVLRFGEYNRTEVPGLHYRLPWPFERVYTPRVTDINKIEIGFVEGRQGRRSVLQESLMLTGDLNIVDINFVVQWKIDSANTDQFLFNVRHAERLVKPIAESAMREVVGQMDLDKIITDGQTEITLKSKAIMQKMLDEYGAGIQIITVNLNKPDVPGEVIDAFQDVKRAEQEKNTFINKAEAYRNDILPRARGKAVKAEQLALAYKKEVVERAVGDTARFLSVYNEYKQAKDITKKRIYLETMEEIMANMNKFVIDGEGKNNILPYLPLNELNRKSGGSQ